MSQRFQWIELEDAAAQPVGRPTEAAPTAATLLVQARRAYLEGDFEPALRAYSSALKHDKSCEEAWAWQVRCLVAMVELREARTWADKAHKLLPQSAVITSALALASSKLGLDAEALSTSDLALEMAERTGLESPALWLDRGAVLLAARRVEPALRCFEKLRELTDDDPDWLQSIAIELLEARVIPQAASCLERVVQARPSRACAWLLQANAFRALGQKKAALLALDQADLLRPNYAASLNLRRALMGPNWLATLQRWMKGIEHGQKTRP